MPDLNPNVTAFERNFDVFDNAAHGGERDQMVSRADIEAVANGQQYSTEQRAAARYLLDHSEEYIVLDTGKNGGGSRAADGMISRGDIDTVIKEAALFAKTGTFASDTSKIPDNVAPGFEDPASAAAQTERVETGSMGDKAAASRSQFMHFVREHQNDPQWLSDYFGALGAEKTAHYLSQVASPGNYHRVSAEHPNQVIGEVRTALTSMYESGALKDADIARLVEHWALDSGDLNTGLPQLFAGLRGDRAQDMQNAFARATTELALHGQEIKNPKFAFSDDVGRMNEGDRQSLAGAAAYVLGHTSWENRTTRLIDLQQAGGDGAIDRFITLAMDNPTKVDGFTRFTYEAQHEHSQGKTLHGSQIEYDGVADLVEALSYDTTYRGGPDRFIPPAPYSYEQLQGLRDQVFYSASNGLDANRGAWQGDTGLKDGLSRIFTADFDRMVREATSVNKGQLDDDHPLPKALENFSQNVLFTEPSGMHRDTTSQFLVNRMSTIVADINTMNDKDFKEKYGASQAQMSAMAGGLLGRVDNGMEQAVEVASDKRATQQKGVEFGIELAWALGQDGVKLLPGGNVIATVLPDSITSSAAYGAIKGEIETMLKQGLTDKAANLLLEKFPDLKGDATLAGLAQELSEVVSIENERDFLSPFISSYERADNNPAAAK